MEVLDVLPHLRMRRFPVGAAHLWRDEDGLPLIDTGTADRTADMESVLNGPLRRIVLMHWHEHHAGSAASAGRPARARRADPARCRGRSPAGGRHGLSG